MSEKSKIEWTDASWNPVRGCTKISPGCAHCYAATFAERFRGVPGHAYERGFDLRLVPDKLNLPTQWKKPKRIFVNSMSDLFHEQVPVDYIRSVCDLMAATPRHTYQVLTKRADRLSELLRGQLRKYAAASHIWWGVSVENRKHGIPRIDCLRAAKVRNSWLSIEPLIENLSEIDLAGIAWIVVGRTCRLRRRRFMAMA
jgi:protein gp37